MASRAHARQRRREKEPWLLIKAKDDEARNPDDPDILEDKPLSVVSGRSIPEIAEGKGRKRVWHSNRSVKDNVTGGATKADASVRRASTSKTSAKASPQSGRRPRPTAAKKKAAKKRTSESSEKEPRPPGAPLPDFVPPSLATLRTKAPSGAGWVHEIKFDGYRIQARLDHGNVRLLTRKGLDWTSKFPNVAAAVAELSARTALVDGEVVILDAGGVSSFSGLQAALKAGERDRFLYYVFDLLHLDGRDLTGVPLIERKAELGRLVGKVQQGTIRYSDDFEESGPTMLQHACGLGLEGIVSKRTDAPYRTGRSETFVKTKCSNAQEFVVGGFAPSNVQPRAIGALVAGYYDQGRFIYAGRIGTGYTQTVARDSVEAAASIGDRQAAVRSNSPRGSPPARRELGRAQNGDRVGIPRVDR